ncbi:hypothetical protein G6F50_015388 [Rhizopus delemar]|uniref:Uncharacterized protein n=1 Tax=Rhizopus delemar TaxID=936053 RepID=A0A9P6XZ59_9FUNG|nr:hypothetical protein G6F50_015388 [Rhizopus delemar]
MGDRHDGAGVARQELVQPRHRRGGEVVGRFVEQQHVRLLQQQAAQRHAALLTTGQLSDHGIPRRQAQCIGGHVQLVFQGVRVAGGQDRLQALLPGTPRPARPGPAALRPRLPRPLHARSWSGPVPVPAPGSQP